MVSGRVPLVGAGRLRGQSFGSIEPDVDLHPFIAAPTAGEHTADTLLRSIAWTCALVMIALTAYLVLGFGRALGETMVLLDVTLLVNILGLGVQQMAMRKFAARHWRMRDTIATQRRNTRRARK